MRAVAYAWCFVVGGALVGCAGANGGSGDFNAGGTGQGGTGQGGSSTGGNGGTINVGATGGTSSGGAGGILTGTPNCPNTNPTGDGDHDGFTLQMGDCNDCTAQMNPGAYDYPGNGVDEDCNGTVDDEPAGCDAQVPDIAYGDPRTAARVIGICRDASGPSWGLIDAKYVRADGSGAMNAMSHGLLSNFGAVGPRDGASMLVLSSGTARAPGQPGYRAPVDGTGLFGGTGMGTQSGPPPGYPIDSPQCGLGGATEGSPANDPAALELTIKTPSNSNQFGFDFDFYTAEYPNYICQAYNDFFVALVDPTPDGSLPAGNISFDAQKNPVSVNNGFLEVCQPGNHGGKSFPCQKGTGELAQTGFDRSAATGWLHTSATVPPGATVRIRFAIWDAGDDILDSTVLIDHLTWDVGQGTPPVTEPVQ